MDLLSAAAEAADLISDWARAAAHLRSALDRIDRAAEPLHAARVMLQLAKCMWGTDRAARLRRDVANPRPQRHTGLLKFRSSPLSPGSPRLRQELIAPAFVAVVPQPDRYLVVAGQLGVEPWDIVLETEDPPAAVNRVEQLLVDWHR